MQSFPLCSSPHLMQHQEPSSSYFTQTLCSGFHPYLTSFSLTLQLLNRKSCEVFTLNISAVHYKTLRQIQPHSMFFAGGQRGSQTSLGHTYISQHRAPLSFTLLGPLLSPNRQTGHPAFPFSPLSVLALKIPDICSG